MTNECINIFISKLNTLRKAGKTVDNTKKTPQLAWMKNLNFTTLPFKTDIPQAVAFLVFLGITSSTRESMSTCDKLSNFESAKTIVQCVVFKNYPYLPHRGDFFLRPPHPSGNFSQVSYIYLDFWAFENPPTPRNFQSLPWEEYGYFLELHNDSSVLNLHHGYFTPR